MSVFREHKTTADRSAQDRRRHRQKIEKAIREGVYDIIADESIIGKEGKTRIKIPVKGIKEYKFIFGDNANNKQVGSAPGQDKSKGQVIGREKTQGQNSGQGNQAGNEAGDESYEIEITLDELAEYLFDALELPDLEKKTLSNIKATKPKRKGHRNQGIRPRLDKKETLKRKLRRQASLKRESENSEIGEDEELTTSMNERDFRYRYVHDKPQESSNAVIFFLMDVSGSMSRNKKSLARSFFFLLYQFLRYKYEKIEVAFISHTTDAKEVTEEQFFTRYESGGTLLSPAIKLVHEIASARYHPDSWNVYAFHASDGDNWPEDYERAVLETKKLKEICQLYCYCEIIPDDAPWPVKISETMNRYIPLSDRKFKTVSITDRTDIWPVFKRIFGGKFDVN